MRASLQASLENVPDDFLGAFGRPRLRETRLVRRFDRRRDPPRLRLELRNLPKKNFRGGRPVRRAAGRTPFHGLFAPPGDRP